ncbi:MAG: MFS transporter [Betaproteobacteria bacterium]|nr:MFS transporter [Betaproteobacteria bacterium]
MTATAGRFAAYYFFYFAFVGVFSPYWSLYLQHLSFGAFDIAVLMSLLQVTRVFAPAAWGWLADRFGRQAAVVRAAALAGMLVFLPVFWVRDFAGMFAVMLLIAFFWSASLPLVEAMTLGHLGQETARYGRIRLWGSIGFVLTVLGCGWWLDHASIDALPWLVLALLAGIAIFAWRLPEAPRQSHPDATPLRDLLRRPAVWALLGACALMSVAHGPYYTLFSVYLAEHGYSKAAIGGLWAVGVVFEIAIFIIMPRLVACWGYLRILQVTFWLGTLRFAVIALAVDSLPLLLAAQTLHAATFAAFHASAVAAVHEYFRGPHQAKGQALYTSLSFGVGGTLGGLLGGALYEAAGGEGAFLMSAVATALGGLILALSAARR